MLNGHSVTPGARGHRKCHCDPAFVTNHTSTHGNQWHYSAHPQTFIDSYIAIAILFPVSYEMHTQLFFRSPVCFAIILKETEQI